MEEKTAGEPGRIAGMEGEIEARMVDEILASSME